MQNKIIYIIALILLITSVGCGRFKGGQAAIEIGKIKVTADEFEQAFKEHYYSREDTSTSREYFLDEFLSRKLLLNEAQKQGLDKDPEFLKDVELFWQQSLIKLLIDKKMRECSSTVKVGDDEIRAFYQLNKDSVYNDLSLESVYEKIKWLLLKEKQQESVNKWIESLRHDVKIKVDKSLLIK